MPGSTILKLTDPEEYHAALSHFQAGDRKAVVTASGSYRAELTLVKLHRLGLHHGQTSLPRIVRGAFGRDVCEFSFQTPDNKAQVVINGVEVSQSHNLVVAGPGADYVASVNTPAERMGGVKISPDVLVAASQALVGYEITTPKALHVIH
jgi:hypothetical protein